MAEANKEEVVKTEETTLTTEPKKKSKTLLYIVIGVLVLFILGGIVVFLVLKGIVKKGVDTLKDEQEIVEQVADDYEITEDEDGEETWTYKKSTEEGVDGKLEKEDLVTEKFPKDIPLSGGIVTGSSYDEYSIDLKIDIDSTVEEIMDWYVEALEEEGWEITSKSSEEPLEGYITGEIEFAKADEERRGTISLEVSPLQKVTSIKIRELLW